MIVKFKSFLRNSAGNFAVVTALGLSAVMVAGGVAVDASSLMQLRAELRDVSDAAALAAAIAANKKDQYGNKVDREAAARASIAANTLNLGPTVTLDDTDIKFDDTKQEVIVSVRATKRLIFSSVFNGDGRPVQAASAASYRVSEVNPVSFAFVVDVSGSMGWCPGQENNNQPCPAGEQPRIETLREATSLLFEQIETNNVNINVLRDKVRTGAWTYRAIAADSINMDYGWGHVENFIDSNKTNPSGGTHSTDAFRSALTALNEEVNIVRDPNLKRFIIFMTDGANNDVDSTLDTQQFCQEAKEDGVSVFAVAFAAPIEGENLLLQCASPNDNEQVSDPGEFEYENAEAEVDAQCKNYTEPGKENQNGNAFGRKKCEDAKSQNYYDADSEEEFKTAFAKIGEELGKVDTRLTR